MGGRLDAFRGLLSLRRGEIHCRIRYALSVFKMLLFDMPQVSQWFRLLYKYHSYQLTLKVSGEEHLSVYRSNLNDRGVYQKDGLGYSRRYFCRDCGTMMRNHNSRHGQRIYLFASSVDTPLPGPPDKRHTMANYKA